MLDVEALASLAPGLQRITPIYVPLDQSFPHSFALFMFGALDPARQGGRLPHILSISDGVCESRFTSRSAEARCAAARPRRPPSASPPSRPPAIWASEGCFINRPGVLFPASSPFTTSVGGTDLTLTGGNQIASQVVWSTFATQPQQGVGTGGGPSKVWHRPGFQQAPGVGPSAAEGTSHPTEPRHRRDGLVHPRPRDLRQGRRRLGDRRWHQRRHTTHGRDRVAGPRAGTGGRPPAVWVRCRRSYTSSRAAPATARSSSTSPAERVRRGPARPWGRRPAGGAAQPGYDLATGLGSLKAAAFADAVAAR